MSFQTIRQSLVKKSVLLIAALSLVAGAQLVALADGASTGAYCCAYVGNANSQAACIDGGCNATYPGDPDKARQCGLNALRVNCSTAN